MCKRGLEYPWSLLQHAESPGSFARGHDCRRIPFRSQLKATFSSREGDAGQQSDKFSLS